MKSNYIGAGLKISIVCFLLFSFCTARSQSNNARKSIPPFHIQLTGGDSLFVKDLKKDSPLMLVYFSPTCEHCQALTRDLLQKITSFNGTQILLLSYQPLTDIEKFQRDFNLEKYPNIKVGTEGYTFIVQKFYNIRNFPFIALYDKKGELLAAYKDVPTIDALVKQLDVNK